jgi:DnaJ-class molecular chaperone
MSEGQADAVAYEEKCARCDGGGRIGRHTCEVCGGSGYVPTEAGERLIIFLRRHLLPAAA